MSATLVLEFEGVDRKQYEAVNEKLGIDASSGEGDWPPGLVTHIAGFTDDGGMLVVEVWDSPDAQAAFMETRLGEALGEAGVPAPTRVTWSETHAHHNP